METYTLMLDLFSRYLKVTSPDKTLDRVTPPDIEAYQRYLTTDSSGTSGMRQACGRILGPGQDGYRRRCGVEAGFRCSIEPTRSRHRLHRTALQPTEEKERHNDALRGPAAGHSHSPSLKVGRTVGVTCEA